uniref:Uncharacterized protein n=1 Tax=Solanum tuberosum TaxID=4113 RepID=M1DMY0_SOLTU
MGKSGNNRIIDECHEIMNCLFDLDDVLVIVIVIVIVIVVCEWDRLPRSGITIGSVATFRHNYGIGSHVPVYIGSDCHVSGIFTRLLIDLASKISDHRVEFKGEAILPGCHGILFRLCPSFLD